MATIPIGDAPRVLIVDEDPEVRMSFATALAIDRYDVRQAGSAEEGLAYLRRLYFSLLLTDYEMPGRTGAAMVQQAHLEGLLSHTPVVIVAAHPGSSELHGSEFRRQIRGLVSTSGGGHALLPPADDCDIEPPRAEFALYVTRCSIPSYHAQRTIERIRKWFVPDQLGIEIVCLEEDEDEDEERAGRDHVTLTPALVRRIPYPKMWLVGDLRDDELLGELIYSSGVDFDDDEPS